MNNLKYKYNREPICPYCQSLCSDAWELFGSEEGDGSTTEVDCDCGETYTVELNVEVTYTTRKRR